MNEFFRRKKREFLGWVGFLFLSVFFIFFLSEKINLVTADLGRHLANGQILFSGGSWEGILKTNFYSYTYPDFPFINHHWLSGVIFFLVWKAVGFVGVQLLFLLTAGLTLGIFFFLARKRGGYFWAMAASLLVLPLLAERQEVRPEIFSCFFGGLFWLILSGFRDKLLSQKWLFILPPALVVWVNLHIAFFLSFLLTGIFLLGALLKKNFSLAKRFGVLLGSLFLAGLINPNGWAGLIYPAKIFDNFGYELAENKSIFFLENFGMQNPNFFLLKMVLLFLAGSLVWVFFKKRDYFQWEDFFLAALFSVLALAALRNMSLAAFFFLPILARNFKVIFPKRLQFDGAVLSAILLGYGGLFFLFYSGTLFSFSSQKGWGILKDGNQAAEFFLQQRLSGPIFNNYDIGGYLIFHLWGREKVFVDNRPEAYPENFFKETYIPAQENQEKWREIQDQYAFNAVFFYRHDLTNWGQNFLISLIDDPDWAPVFVDQQSIIFLKKNEKNQPIIDKFQIPRETFQINN